jgi:Beta propeller domain
MRRLVNLCVLTLALCACSSSPEKSDVHRARLLPLASCGDLAEQMRERALREMNRKLDEALAQALADAASGACNRPSPQGGYGASDTRTGVPVPATATAAPNSGGAAARPESAGASSYSGTNNQVAGVDEADFVKNDAKYIYVAQGSSFRIVEAWPPTTASTVAKVTIEGEARRLFVTETHALIYSSLPVQPSSGGALAPGATSRPVGSSGGGGRECTYGYDCEFTGDGKPTKLTILDIRDRRAPVLVREITTDGSYVNARRIGAAVFTVLTALTNPFPNLGTWPTDLPACGAPYRELQIQAAFDRLREKNRELIAQAQLGSIIPTLRQTVHRAGAAPAISENALAECRGFYAETVGDGDAFTTVLALNMNQGEALETATVYSRPGAVYAYDGALYLAVPHQQQAGRAWYVERPDLKQVSSVHKFSLGGGASPVVAYLGSGLVKGRVLNQFAMDEYQGFLRVATTTSRTPDPKVHSTMSVLGEGEAALETQGELDDLAPGEDIRSVRFDGDRGYVVTFKKTDPLFVFDLTDPRAPRVEAELKIPGFSTYMHRMDRNHLLTIGYDAADQGNFAYFTGVLLQIFDVTDPRQPFLKHKQVIGTRGSSSEALTNHLAFNYFAPRDLLLLPMTVCETPPGSTSLFNARPSFSGLIAYNVTTGNGFREDGRVNHPAGPTVNCGNWWTNASSQVRRSIVMDDFVFSLSGSQIKINHLGALATDVTTVSLTD